MKPITQKKMFFFTAAMTISQLYPRRLKTWVKTFAINDESHVTWCLSSVKQIKTAFVTVSGTAVWLFSCVRVCAFSFCFSALFCFFCFFSVLFLFFFCFSLVFFLFNFVFFLFYLFFYFSFCVFCVLFCFCFVLFCAFLFFFVFLL